MKLKIGVCVNHYSPSIGGAEIVAQTIVEHLSRQHDVFVMTRRLEQRRDLRDFDYPIFEYRPGDIVTFDKQLKKSAPDILLIYSDVFDFFRQLVVKTYPFKLVLALCGANWLYSHRNYMKILYRNSNNIHAIILHSKHERDYKICSPERLQDKIFIIPNGVWTSEFDDNTLTRQDLANDIVDRQWILNVSNFFPGKGQEHLIKILDQLKNPEQIAYIQVSSDVDFPIGKQLEMRWRSKVSQLKNKGIAVKLMKNIKRERVIGLFKQSNVFAFTSEKEVAPIVLLESMAASLPWIASNIGNVQDLKGGICVASMKDSRFHSAFDQRTCLGFSTGIQELLCNPSVGDEGRKQIDEKLNWDNILPQYAKIIEGQFYAKD